MWPFIILGAGVLSIAAFAMSRKKRVVGGQPTVAAPTTSTSHVDAMRAAVREPSAPAPSRPVATTPRAAENRPLTAADAATIRTRADLVAAYLRKYQHQYDPSIVRDFQRLAGLTADGVYGRVTRAALIRYGVPAALAPAALGTSTRLFGRG